MGSSHRFVGVALPVALLAVSCSEVLILPDETVSGGGAGGAPVGTTTTESTATITQASSSSSTSGPMSSSSTGMLSALCQTFCGATGDCIDDCAAACDSFQVEPCAAQGAALVECVNQSYDVESCSVPPENEGELNGCWAETQALLACRGNMIDACGSGSPVGFIPELAPGLCTNDVPCDGGERRVDCTLQDGAAACQCFLNTLPIALCSGTFQPLDDWEEACGDVTSCCDPLWGPSQ